LAWQRRRPRAVDYGGNDQQPKCTGQNATCAKDDMDAIFHSLSIIQNSRNCNKYRTCNYPIFSADVHAKRLGVIFREVLARKWGK
jgi:hypothetical protein